MSNCQWTDGLTAVCAGIWYTLAVRAILQIRPKTEAGAGFVKIAVFGRIRNPVQPYLWEYNVTKPIGLMDPKNIAL